MRQRSQELERDEIRVGAMTTAHFSSRARTQRSRSAASRGSLYFAWGCFRDFLSRPCRAPPKGRYAGSGTRDRQCLALTGRIDPVPTHHALGLAEARRHPHASNARSGHVGSRIGHHGMVAMLRPYSGLMPAARTTLPHFSVSSEISLPNSAGDPPSGSPPMAANRAFIPASAIAALISLLSLSTISTGVFLGAPMPYHW